MKFFTVIIPAIAALVTAFGTLYQALKPNDVLVVSDKSIIRENDSMRNEMDRLIKEKDALDKQIKVMATQIDIKSYHPADENKDVSIVEAENQHSVLQFDKFWITALKTLAVYVCLFIAAMLTIVSLSVDIVSLPSGSGFHFTKALWEFAWNRVTIDWYWSVGTWYGILTGVGAILLFGALADTNADDSQSKS